MTQEQTRAQRIIATVSHSRGCLIEEVVECSGLSWNQVFAAVERMSRTGQFLLARKGPDVYAVLMPTP